jgi:isorenieratene synthase
MNGQWRPGRDRKAVRHPALDGALRAPQPAPRVLVVGGGVAGIAAAVGLAERGVRVVLAERQPQLGGRVRSWPVTHDGAEDEVTMSRGFHAFFRQYYNLRALLRRVDPALSGLTPVSDYPVVMADGAADSFARVPRTPPVNLFWYALRSPNFGPRALFKADIAASSSMLDLDFPQAFDDFDAVSAETFLDQLNFPPAVRHLALEVFTRSFFADPDEYAAGELLAMFHLYFVGSAEGLLFDVATDDFNRVFWNPLQEYLVRRGVQVLTGTPVDDLRFTADGPVRAAVGGDGIQTDIEVDAVVLAADPRGTRGLVAGATGLSTQGWRESLARTGNAPRFVVWRLWLDTPVRADRPAFLGTGGFDLLDNVSVLERYEAGARRWAATHGGSVVEVHAYAIADSWSELALRDELRAELAAVFPETRSATVLADEWLVSDDCPSFRPGERAHRPGVRTDDTRLVLAGDGVRCDLPVALMERAATTGWQAANALLAGWGLRGQDLWSVPLSSRVPAIRTLRRLAV